MISKRDSTKSPHLFLGRLRLLWAEVMRLSLVRVIGWVLLLGKIEIHTKICFVGRLANILVIN